MQNEDVSWGGTSARDIDEAVLTSWHTEHANVVDHSRCRTRYTVQFYEYP
jgi:hypothetical protein